MRRFLITRRRLASGEEALAAMRAMTAAAGKPRQMDIAREAVFVMLIAPASEPAV